VLGTYIDTYFYISVCKDQCVKDSNCDGLDWDSTTKRCYKYKWTARTEIEEGVPGFTHLDLFRFCPSTYT